MLHVALLGVYGSHDESGGDPLSSEPGSDQLDQVDQLAATSDQRPAIRWTSCPLGGSALVAHQHDSFILIGPLLHTRLNFE